MNNYTKIISNPKFEITSWTDHFLTDEFQKSMGAVLNFYSNNNTFKNEIDAVALSFLKYSKFLSKNNDFNLVN